MFAIEMDPGGVRRCRRRTVSQAVQRTYYWDGVHVRHLRSLLHTTGHNAHQGTTLDHIQALLRRTGAKAARHTQTSRSSVNDVLL